MSSLLRHGRSCLYKSATALPACLDNVQCLSDDMPHQSSFRATRAADSIIKCCSAPEQPALQHVHTLLHYQHEQCHVMHRPCWSDHSMLSRLTSCCPDHAIQTGLLQDVPHPAATARYFLSICKGSCRLHSNTPGPNQNVQPYIELFETARTILLTVRFCDSEDTSRITQGWKKESMCSMLDSRELGCIIAMA